MLPKISILFQALKKPTVSLALLSAALFVALAFQHKKLEISGLKNDALQSQLESCFKANQSASNAILRLEEVQKTAETKRIEALEKQREMLEKLYAPREIKITSEDECANSVVPDDIRLRFKPDN